MKGHRRKVIGKIVGSDTRIFSFTEQLLKSGMNRNGGAGGG